jgi:simple sugar transport system permease protein
MKLRGLMANADRRHALLLLGIVVAQFVILSLLRPDAYPTTRNLVSMSFQMSEVGILALAVGLTLLIGGIDLSIAATANLAGIVAAQTMTALAPSLGSTGAIGVGVGAALAVGVVTGTMNGFLVTRLGASPIVITLGTLTLYTGIGTVLTGGSTQFGIAGFQRLGAVTFAALPGMLWLFLALTGLLAAVTGYRRWGFRAYMVGSSDVVARYSRINVRRVQIMAYTASGVLSAGAGLLILARTNAASVTFGTTYLLLAILVAVLAGINPYGGSGRLLAVPLAMAAMQQVSTGMNMALGRHPGANFVKEFAWGVMLIAVLAIASLTRGVSFRDVLTGRSGTGPPEAGAAVEPASAAEVPNDEPTVPAGLVKSADEAAPPADPSG